VKWNLQYALHSVLHEYRWYPGSAQLGATASLKCLEKAENTPEKAWENTPENTKECNASLRDL
jgi:hypothetical protein